MAELLLLSTKHFEARNDQGSLASVVEDGQAAEAVGDEISGVNYSSPADLARSSLDSTSQISSFKAVACAKSR